MTARVDLLGRYSNQETLLSSLIRAADPQHRGLPIARTRTRKQRHTRLTDAEVDVLVAAYGSGLSLEDVASAFSIDRRTASNHLKRRGVATRGRALTDAEITEAIEMYEHGWSLAKLSERYGVYPQSIRYRLLRRGVTMRPRPGR